MVQASLTSKSPAPFRFVSCHLEPEALADLLGKAPLKNRLAPQAQWDKGQRVSDGIDS